MIPTACRRSSALGAWVLVCLIKASIAPKVKSRLEALRAGKPEFRFECHSG